MSGSVRSLAGLATLVAAFALPAAAAAQSSPSPYTSATRYDLAGRVTGTISADPDGVGTGNPFLATRTTYDIRGNVTKVETGSLSSWQDQTKNPLTDWGAAFTAYTTSLTTYDGLDRKVTVTFEGSDLVPVSLTQYSYDVVGRIECTAVRMNPAVYGSLPATACTQGTAGSYGPDRITKNVYDNAGQLVQVREGVGSADEGSEVTYSYTANGKKQYVIDANGNRAQLTYDGHDRQISWIFPSTTRPGSFNDSTPANALATAGSVNSADHEDYTYDASGNRTSLRKRDGSDIGYTYDNLNRLTLKDIDVNNERTDLASTHKRDVYYGYDAQGHQTYARFDSPAGEGVTYTYTGFGSLLTETQAMDGATRTLTSNYDLDQSRTYLNYPDGNSVYYYRDGLDRLYYAALNGSSPLFYPPYDAAGRVSVLYRLSTATGTWDQATQFWYDNASRLSAIGLNPLGSPYDSNTTFTRNPASQITSMARSNDAYAWNGAVSVNRGYTANGLNQYSAAGSASFTYDANGNLTSDGTYTYLYDVENRLVSRTGSGTTVTLRYDPTGRLYEVNSSATGITRFLNDGDAMVAEYNSAGTLLRRFVHGTDAGDDPLVWFEGSSVADSARRYLYADEHGSIAAVTDGSGNVTNINTYDEYGIPGAGNVGRFQYTGQAWLPEIGMYYYKARIYSPTLGRFLQTDPIGYTDQFNLYAYVGDDPVEKVDPTGECTVATGSIACRNDSGTSTRAMQYRKAFQGGKVTRAINDKVARQQQSGGEQSNPNAAGASVIGAVGAAQDAFGEAASTQGAHAAGKIFKGFGAAAAVGGAYVDARGQIASGKPADQAYVNAGSKAGVSVAAGAIATVSVAGASESGGLTMVAGAAASVGVDIVWGEKIGTTGESIYKAVRDSGLTYNPSGCLSGAAIGVPTC